MKSGIETRIDSPWVEDLLHICADREVLPRYNAVRSARKPDGSLVTSADIESQHFLTAALAERYPGISLLGEEMDPHDQERLLARGGPLWCLDPLDGTSNFSAGVPVFGLSLALVEEGETRAGWIYDPVRGESFRAVAGQGAWLGRDRLGPREAPPLAETVGVLDFKRLPRPLARRIIDERPFHSQRNFGASVLEWCWLAAGRYHFCLHGGQRLWDLAAGVLVLKEAGGVASTLEGLALRSDRLGPQSVLATLDPVLHEAWREWLTRETG